MLSALSLAACYDASHVIIDSDSKTFIDSISSTRDTIPWRLNHFVEAIHVACFSLEAASFVSFVSLCVPLRTLSSEATQRWLFFLGFSSNLISSGRRSDESLSSGTKHSEFNLGIHLGVVVNV
nr:hypothetical protein CFP56_36987 [Quercus suber]